MALLDVHDLRVGLNTSRGPADALRGVSFSIDRGDTVGLIGESGCGKSMTALALMGLLPPGARVSGSIRFYSQEHPRPLAAPGVRGETSLLPPPLGEGPFHSLPRWGRVGGGGTHEAACLNALPPSQPSPKGGRSRSRWHRSGVVSHELVGADDAAMCKLRGNRIGMIFQEPMTALNPLHTVGAQVAEPLRQHRGMGRAESRAEALRLLNRVRLPQAAQRLDAYPHQLSGGQRQRVMIAAALACGPDLLIADEPTTALDVSVQGEILDLIAELAAETGMALLLISHDLGVMAQTVQRVMVMYGGMVVESGPTASVFERLAHPYTRGLFGARPRLGAARVNGHMPSLATIAGRMPELVDLPAGCPFADRCERVLAACRVAPPDAVTVAVGHSVRCLNPHGSFPLDRESGMRW